MCNFRPALTRDLYRVVRVFRRAEALKTSSPRRPRSKTLGKPGQFSKPGIADRPDLQLPPFQPPCAMRAGGFFLYTAKDTRL